MPLIPMPPMPTKWTCLVFPSTSTTRFGVQGSGCWVRSGSGFVEPRTPNPEPRTSNPERERTLNPEPGTRNPSASLFRQLDRAVNDHFCCVRLRQPTCRRRHAPPPLAIQGQRPDAIRQPRTGDVLLQQDLRCTSGRQRFGVLALVIVRGGRQRNE